MHQLNICSVNTKIVPVFPRIQLRIYSEINHFLLLVHPFCEIHSVESIKSPYLDIGKQISQLTE